MKMNLCMLMIVNLGMASADDVCTAVKSNLPDSCACVAAGRLGGKVTCTESIDLGVPKGKFEATFALDLKACGSPASIELTATFPEVDPMTEKFEASVDPGSITIPVGAAISIPGIDVLVGYDLKESEGNLAVKLSVDACFGVAPARVCFSTLDFSKLPKADDCNCGLSCTAFFTTNAVACAESTFLSKLNGGTIPVLPIKFPLEVLDTTIKTSFCAPPPGTCVETAKPSVAADKTACDAVTALTDTTACSAVMKAAAAEVAACTFTAAAPAPAPAPASASVPGGAAGAPPGGAAGAPPSGKSKSKTGAIVGGIFGGLCAALLVVAAVIYTRRLAKRSAKDAFAVLDNGNGDDDDATALNDDENEDGDSTI